MSGGHFDYVQYRITTAVDELKEEVHANEYSEEVLEIMKEAHDLLSEGALLLNEIDWLISGDVGEERFLQRVKERRDLLNKA